MAQITKYIAMKRLLMFFALALTIVSCEQIEDFFDKRGHGLTFIEGEMKAIFPDKGDTKNYKFTSEYDWQAEVSADWVEVKPASGKAGENKIQIKVDKNKSDQKRIGYVDITLSNNESYRIELEQMAAGESSGDGGEGGNDGGNDDGNDDGNEDTENDFVLSSDIPNNQIWYTTTDGCAIELRDYNGANTPVVSNTYTDGQGVITFESDVVEIGYLFMDGYDNLETLVLPGTLTTIRGHAFSNCKALSYVNIPKSVRCINNSAFDYDVIATVVYEGRYDDWFDIFFETRGSNPVHNGGDLYIDGKLLRGEVVVPTYLVDLGYYFTGVSAETFILHDNITTISSKAFEDCRLLKYITIPESVSYICDGAFADCISLESVYCKPTTPPYLEWEVFMAIEADPAYEYLGCMIYVPAESYLDYIYAEGWRDYADYIVAYDFANDQIVDVEKPEVPTEIQNNQIMYTSNYGIVYPYDDTAFNAAIVSNVYYGDCGIITFDAELTEIGDYAFAHSWDIKSLTLPESVVSVGECLVKDCSSFERFNGKFATEDGSALIANGVFIACTPNTISEQYIIPEGVKRIGACAFRECEYITSVYIPDSVESVGEGAFSSSSGFQYFSGKFVTEDNLAVICDNTFIGYATGNTNVSYSIPEGVTRIGWYAFDNCTYLKEITIPESVVEIGDVSMAFCYDLETVYCKPTTPPTALLDYNGGWEVFDYNYNTTIYVPMESVDAYKNAEHWSQYRDYIVGYDFENGKQEEGSQVVGENKIYYTTTNGEFARPFSLDNVVSNIYENGLGTITFNGEISVISDLAFYGCPNLKTITIPDSVESINLAAFNVCSSLESVVISKNIKYIGIKAFSTCKKLSEVYCRALEPPVLDSNVFIFGSAGRTYYVPYESVELYKNADRWKSYASSIVGYDFDNNCVVE